jgi:hypothetical protein
MTTFCRTCNKRLSSPQGVFRNSDRPSPGLRPGGELQGWNFHPLFAAHPAIANPAAFVESGRHRDQSDTAENEFSFDPTAFPFSRPRHFDENPTTTFCRTCNKRSSSPQGVFRNSGRTSPGLRPGGESIGQGVHFLDQPVFLEFVLERPSADPQHGGGPLPV